MIVFTHITDHLMMHWQMAIKLLHFKTLLGKIYLNFLHSEHLGGDTMMQK